METMTARVHCSRRLVGHVLEMPIPWNAGNFRSIKLSLRSKAKHELTSEKVFPVDDASSGAIAVLFCCTFEFGVRGLNLFEGMLRVSPI